MTALSDSQPAGLAAPTSWLLTRPDGTVVAVGDTPGPFVEQPPHSMVGRRLQDVLPAAWRTRVEGALARAVSDGSACLSVTLPSASGPQAYRVELSRVHGIDGLAAVVQALPTSQLAATERDHMDAFVALLLKLAGDLINLPASRLDAAIQQALGDTGRFAAAGRAYLFHYDWGRRIGVNTHEWCAPGVEPQIDNLQAVPMDLVPDWLDAHQQGLPVHVPDVQQLPAGDLRDILEAQGIRTTVALPLTGPDGCSGFVGFDFLAAPRTLTREELDLLQLFARMLVNVGDRIRSETLLAQVNASLEERVAERTHELQQAKERAVDADRAKSALMARVSHELRTPLNAVLGFAQLLAVDDALRASARAQLQLEQIRSAGEHLLHMVDDLLDLAHAESGRLQVACEPVELHELAGRTLALAQPLAQHHGVSLHGPAGGPQTWVRGDPTRVRQVLMNLVSNAIKYNRAGGSVTVDIDGTAADPVLRVLDTGRGLTAPQLAQLFEPFNRVGAEHGAVEGTGLGLSIARQLVVLMGGHLAVDSEPGRGTVVSLSLPRAQAPTRQAPQPPGGPQAPAADRPALPATPAAAVAPALRVLYVEDNPVNTLLMQAMVAQAECGPVELHVAADGRAALDLAARVGPELMLLDMSLPDMSGLDLLGRLQAMPALAGVPCVAVSANAMAADIDAALRAGFVDYVTKPFPLEQMARLLARHRPSNDGGGAAA